jgi:hypothetical protein
MIDDDLTDLRFIGSSLPVGPVSLYISIPDYSFSLGSHTLSYYAVDYPYGRISPAVTYSFTVMRDATISRSPSPTRSASPRATVTVTPLESQTPTPPASISQSASPFPTPTPLIPLRFGLSTVDDYNFYVCGDVVSGEIRLTPNNQGFMTRVRINGGQEQSPFQKGNPWTSGNVRITTFSTQIGASVIFVGFKLENTGSSSVTIDLTCYGQLNVDGRANSPCSSLPDGRGIWMPGNQYNFALIGRSYPLVQDVYGYWFGSNTYLDYSHWEDMTGSGPVSVTNVACSFSWQTNVVPGGSYRTIGVLFRAADYFENPPELWLNDSSLIGIVGISQTVEVNGLVTSSNPGVIIDLLW